MIDPNAKEGGAIYLPWQPPPHTRPVPPKMFRNPNFDGIVQMVCTIANSRIKCVKYLNSSFSTRCTHFFLESKSIVTFALSITYTLLDRVKKVKKDERLENKNFHLVSKEHFWFSNCSSFFTRRFLNLFDFSGPWCATPRGNRPDSPRHNLQRFMRKFTLVKKR